MYTKELDFAKELAYNAGKIMLTHFMNTKKSSRLKSDDSPVTKADLEINSLILKAISKNYPLHNIISEEKSNVKESEYSWVCDPIDGTFGYNKGIPTAVFSLALCKKGKPVVAVIYEPFLDRLYWCEGSKGVYCNSIKLKKLSKNELSNEVISVDLEMWADSKTSVLNSSSIFFGRLVNEFERNGIWFSVLNSAVYGAMLVINGNYSSVIYSGKSPWDAVAAELMISELGGFTSDFYGKEKQLYNKDINGFIATVPQHSKKIQQLLNELRRKK